ncbi:MAG: aminomethyltransferase [Acidimicrobiia bacterium]|nr:aminomethyltransferase [Acidimicrobiia bacterium]
MRHHRTTPDDTEEPPLDDEHLRRTSLYDLHRSHGGRMVAFAGYEMPVRYEPGPMAEHQQCRTRAALFDVAHMGVVNLSGPAVAEALEQLVPSAIATLGPQRMRYTLLTNDDGGVIDDIMVAKEDANRLTLVVNAAGKDADIEHLRAGLPDAIKVEHRTDLALLALQGPEAVAVLRRLAPEVAGLTFMQTGSAKVAGIPVAVSRSGYTGEDGFELTVATDKAVPLAEVLLAEPEAQLAGLAARDSLRLEAGLCLYGHDLDQATSPIEAALGWTIQARRRTEANFPGAVRILAELRDGPRRRRVGLAPVGRKPVRDGAALRASDGSPAGYVTSGGYGPTVGAPIAMGYVPDGLDAAGTELIADVRGTDVPCRVIELPFVPHRYVRGG